MTAYAKVIADSVSPEGVRLTTIEGRFRRFVLAEANTHRVLSKNSASSRAIPFAKQVAKIREDLAYPEVWASEQKGMQGGDEIPAWQQESARDTWRLAADEAIVLAEHLAGLGVHKSIVNRLLEPFMWHTVVFTATAWDNFFAQRCSPLAQPEIRVFAEAVRDAMAKSTPANTEAGWWHLPYVGDDAETLDYLAGQYDAPAPWDLAAKVSAARCARVSYLTQDGRRDPEEDLRLYERLTEAQPPHWSPLEHVATPWGSNRQSTGLDFMGLDGEFRYVNTDHLPRVGNLLGWRSLRTEVEAMQDAVTYR